MKVLFKQLSILILSVGLLTACGGGTATVPTPSADTTAPVVTAPGNITVTAAQGATVVSPTNTVIAAFLNGATATDNVAVVGAITQDAPASFPVGVTTVTFTAKDAANNSGTATATVTVNASPATGGGGIVDTIAPVVTAPTNITLTATQGATSVPATNAAIAAFLNAATATDNVGVVGVITNDAPASFPVGGTTAVTFTAKDAANNNGTATASVTVNAAPTVGVITLNASTFCPVNPPAVVTPTLNGWNWANPSPQGASLQTVVEGNGVFLAAGDNGQLLRSTDKITWTLVDSGTRNQISKIYWDGSAFIMPLDTTVRISCDGLHWSTNNLVVTNGVASNVSSMLMANKYYAFSGSNMFQSVDAVNWTGASIPEVTNIGTFASVTKVANNGTTFVAQVSNPAAYIVSNDAGVTWQTVASPPTQTKYLIWNGTQFVALSTSGAQLSTSSDGITWANTAVTTFPPAFSTVYRSHLMYFGGVPVLLGGNDFTQVSSYNNNGGFYVLTAANAWNHADWHDTAGKPLLKVNDAIVTTSNTLLVVGDGGMIVEQTGVSLPISPLLNPVNGVNKNTWTRRAGESASLLTSVATNGASYVAVGLGASILYSTDGLAWTRPVLPTYKPKVWSAPTPVSAEIGRVEWTGTEYVALGDTGMILSSADGLAWVIEKKPGTKNSEQTPFMSTYFSNKLIWKGTFAVKTRIAKNTFATTDPAIGATLAGGATTVAYGGFANNGTRLVAVGNFGISTSLDATTWALVNLTNIPNSANFDFVGVAHNGTKFLAVANYPITDLITNIVTNNEIILESTDGLAWTQITTFPNGPPNLHYSLSNGRARNVLRSGSGKFIGFRPSISDPVESVDGVTWVDVLTPGGANTVNAQAGSLVYNASGSYYRKSWGDYLQTPTREILVGFRNGIIVK